jgi:predicted ATPase
MIDTLTVQDSLDESKAFSYASSIPFLKEHPTIKFKKGLNIVFGQNGSGKSTILKMMGSTLAAIQGGRSVLTKQYAFDHANMGFGCTLIHDGQGIMYCDPTTDIGLIGGQFDSDFMMEGVSSVVFSSKESNGYKTLKKVEPILNVIMGKAEFPKDIENRIDYHRLTQEPFFAHSITGSIPIGQPSLLMDEPDTHLSLPVQRNLWQVLGNPKYAENFQLIIATHSLFALDIPHANYIDMQDGYRETCKETLKAFVQSL